MKCNPGGQLALADIIGRDQLVTLLWETLEQQSVVMTAERRIGKTHVMQLLEEKPPEGWITIYADLEKIQRVDEFAKLVHQMVQRHLPLLAQTMNLAKDVAKKLQGAEIQGFKLPDMADQPWQTVLQTAITTLMQAQEAANQRVLFLWDEVPYMLSNILKNDGSSATMQALDTLRSLRKDHPGFRLVITGSIGLHHVIGELHQQGYRNKPVNDLYTINVEPLQQNHAQDLAQQLITGECIEVDDKLEVATAITQHSDGFPFYIHHIVKALKGLPDQQALNADTVQCVVQAQLIDDNDPWELQHYEDRLKDYYPDQHAVVKLALDELALADTGLSAKALLQRIKQQRDFDDLDTLRDLLARLNKDHYLAKSIEGKYAFRFSLIQRWWCMHRELEQH